MARKQWSTTFNEDILKNFQNTCESYDMKANTVLEALMKFFSDGNCRLIIDKSGCQIELANRREIEEMQRQIAELQEKLKTI